MGEDGLFRNGTGCFSGKRWGATEALVAVLGCLLCFRRQAQRSVVRHYCANVPMWHRKQTVPLGLRLIGLIGLLHQ